MTAPPRISPELLDAVVELMGSSGRQGEVRVLGESMCPTIPPGSTLLVEFAPWDPRRGDLLLFRQANYLAVHRLLGRAKRPDGKPCWRTRGDNVAVLDPPVDPSSVVARVVAVRRDGTWIGLSGRGAKTFAWLLALHDLAWAAFGVLADRSVDRILRRLGAGVSLRSILARADRALLRLADAFLYRALHRPLAAPPGAAPPAAPRE